MLDAGDELFLEITAKVDPKSEYHARKAGADGMWEIEWRVRLTDGTIDLARFIHALSMRLKAQMEKIADKSKAAREALEEAERLGRENAG